MKRPHWLHFHRHHNPRIHPLAYILSLATLPLLIILFFLPLFTPQPSPSLTPTPTSQFQPIIFPSPTPLPPTQSPPPAYSLPASTWIPQTFNNCGPATVSMLLQHFGYNIPQSQTKSDLRSNPDDKNVFTHEISTYLQQKYGIQSKLLYNGNLKLIKTLLANGFYIFTETFLHPDDDIGHTILIRGYDDTRQVLITDDPYFAVGQEYSYDTFDQKHWKPFNREYMPIYMPSQEPLLKAIIGDNWQSQTMYQNSIDFNLTQTQLHPQDPYDWFNLGTSYFGAGLYSQAADAFATSQSLGWPYRMLWYQLQPIQTHLELGNYQQALNLSHLALRENQSFPEAQLLQAQSLIGLNQINQARQALQRTLQFDPNNQEAKELLNTL